MSLTAYDNSFSFRQNELATKGVQGPRGLNKEQYEKFKASPFMQRAQAQEQCTVQLTGERDKRRKARDPAFEPSDEDFTAPKAFAYEVNVDYYKVLGVEDLASQDEIKKAYKKLSLLYHPDKTTNLPDDEREEHAIIFIELKNAYLTLNDQATRRQYDRDRDHMAAGEQVNGYKKKQDKVPFDATAVLAKLKEMQKPPGKEVLVEIYCKLEKMFYGGSKSHTRCRRLIREHCEFYDDKHFRIDVPRFCSEKWSCSMKGGDMNWNTLPDTLKFVVMSKPHATLERQEDDLHMKRPVLLKPDALLKPYLDFEVPTIAGRHLLIWGRNPFYCEASANEASLVVRVRGEAFGPGGELHFAAKLDTPARAGVANLSVVSVMTTYTKLRFFCACRLDATVEDLKQSIRDVLRWPDDQAVTIWPALGGKKGEPFSSDEAKLGGLRDVILEPPARLYEVPMSVGRARDLLNSSLVFAGREQFAKALRKCEQAKGGTELPRLLGELWKDAVSLAPFYGYAADLRSFRRAVQRALWVVAGEPDGPLLQGRLAACGFLPRQPSPPRIVRRRKLLVSAEDAFLARNGLGPPAWGPSGEEMPEPGSETDPEQSDEDAALSDDDASWFACPSSKSAARHGCRGQRPLHGGVAAAVHPEMLKRQGRRAQLSPVCELELAPLLDSRAGLQLFTQPGCTLHFYSNLKQAWHSRQGHVKPQLCFAIAVACPPGGKRGGRDAWKRLRFSLMPMLKQLAFLAVRECRGILPRALHSKCAFEEQCYRVEEGVTVMRPGESSEQDRHEEEASDDEAKVMRLARHRIATADAASGGAPRSMFDFDDLEDGDRLEDVAAEVREELRDARRKRSAVREVWRREARQQAKRSEYIKAASAAQRTAGGGDTANQGWLTAALAKQFAKRAFRHCDYFTAHRYFAEELLLLPGDAAVDRATALSNRSACLLHVGHFDEALVCARAAAELRPDWGRAWARCGEALGRQGRPTCEEAREAWFAAVRCDPRAEHLSGLHDASKAAESSEGAREQKEKGNLSFRAQEWGEAIAHYTIALALLPAPALDRRRKDDDTALFRAILYSNRCLALVHLKLWQLALVDGQTAVEHKEDYGRAHSRLGVAQLGCQMPESAYASFARALKADEKDRRARGGRETCLRIIPHWESAAALRRRVRFSRDFYRPAGQTRVFSVSDVHFDHPQNEEWVNSIHSTKFAEDVLIIAGNLADSLKAVERGLTALRAKFRRIFFVPGNHELWVTRPEEKKFPDSFCKLWAILELCDDLDVDVFPAAVCQEVFVVPLLSWYNAAFDQRDPFPDPASQADKHAKWPMDADQQLWRYMLRLNQANLEKPFHGTVITCSHFAPKAGCPVWADKSSRKTSGCDEVFEQALAVRSSCHVYGHTMCPLNQVVDGVKLVNRPVHVDVGNDGVVSREPLVCVFDGQALCYDLVDI